MQRIVFLIVSLLFTSLTAYAQKGTLTGTVTEASNGEPIPFADVFVSSLKLGANTDFDGNYTISLPAGTHEVTISFLGYETQKKTITIKAGETLRENIKLAEESVVLGGVDVVVTVNRGTEAALKLERKEAAAVVQKIGQQELQRKGVSNAAQGVSKVAGVSLVGSKQLFVRGMGDRYNNAMLNDLPIPSTNPDLKVIPLDIFPSSIISDLSVTKTFSADQYGDFAGGTINIRTRGFPQKPMFMVRFSVGYNSQATFRDFESSNRSFGARIGYDNSRNMPGSVNALRYPEPGQPPYVYQTPTTGEASPFQTPFAPNRYKAPLSMGITVANGNLYKFNEGRSEFGYILNLSHSNDYNYTPGRYAFYNAQLSERFNYAVDRYTYNTSTTAMLNLHYRVNAKNKFGFQTLYVNQSADDFATYVGNDFDLGPVASRRNTYNNYGLWVNQLNGYHETGKNSKFTWAASYAQSLATEPDRVQNSFRTVSNAGELQYFFLQDAVSNNHRFFSDLNESEINGRADYQFALFTKEDEKPKTTFLVGYQGKLKERTFRARQIDMDMNFGQEAVDLDQIDENFLNDANLGINGNPQKYRYFETYYPSNDYDADLNVQAGHITWNQVWKEDRLQSFVGLRAEYSVQSTLYKQLGDPLTRKPRLAQLDTLALLPSVGLKYTPSDRIVWFVGASQTMTRPSFLEFTPFRYNEAFGGFETQGNPNLTNGFNYNVDAKFEFYPTPGEIIGVSAFYKQLNDPIERIIVPTSGNLISFINSDNVNVYGVEFEFNRTLFGLFNMTADWTRNASFGTNLAYMYTEVSIDPTKFFPGLGFIAPTNPKRPMVGASPYLVNADVNYRINYTEKTNTLLTLVYNVYGRRLFSAGFQGVGDVYELPVNTLDLSTSTRFGSNWVVDLRVNNILNPQVIREQEGPNDRTQEVNSFRRGVDVIVRVAYRIGD